MGLSDYNPSDAFPDVDGTGLHGSAGGPLQLPADQDVFTYDTHYVSASAKHGLYGKIINALLYLGKRTPSWNTGTVVRACPPIFLVGSTMNMDFGSVPNGGALAVGATQYFEPPHGSTLTKVTVTVLAGHTPPAGNKVAAQAYKRNIATGSQTYLASPITDPATGAGYSAAHTFDVATGSEVIDLTTYTYGIGFIGESSTGAGSVTWEGSTYTVTV